MKLKQLFVCLVFLCPLVLIAQSKTQTEFNAFFETQDGLLSAAAQNNDAKTYESLLNEVFVKYEKLPKKYQKAFGSYNSYKQNYLYNLCCIYSLQNDSKNALSYLEKSINTGFFDYEHISTDSDLDNIRNNSEFKALVEPLKTHYLDILKNAADYNLSDKRKLPEFVYQSMEDENLVKLRQEFNLDSIAGDGNEVSKILNLMYWVHATIKHDGSSNNPDGQNAANILAVCKNEDRGVNCRMMATVLNECYLAIGIKSRHITCMPSEEDFDDCHVINMVYSSDLQKWLWIDPTFAAYVMDESGNMLSIQEVRERLVLNQPLQLNADANWNFTITQTKAYYLESYMAKNLYRIQAPVKSEFNYETKEPGVQRSYVELLPLDYPKQKPNVTKYRNAQKEVVSLNYLTNNPNLFWAAPSE